MAKTDCFLYKTQLFSKYLNISNKKAAPSGSFDFGRVYALTASSSALMFSRIARLTQIMSIAMVP